MKYLITIFFAAIYCLNAFNQEVTDTLYVSIDHNLFLVFDDKATSLSGNSFIKTKSGGDNDNTVVVMGLEEDFPECNLLVTVEDKMYMFIVRYTPYPKKFIYNSMNYNVNSKI